MAMQSAEQNIDNLKGITFTNMCNSTGSLKQFDKKIVEKIVSGLYTRRDYFGSLAVELDRHSNMNKKRANAFFGHIFKTVVPSIEWTNEPKKSCLEVCPKNNLLFFDRIVSEFPYRITHITHI